MIRDVEGYLPLCRGLRPALTVRCWVVCCHAEVFVREVPGASTWGAQVGARVAPRGPTLHTILQTGVCVSP